MVQCLYCLTHTDGNFCTQCGWKFPDSIEEHIITFYFRKGYNYDTILKFIDRFHNICISLRTLKKRLKEYGLSRRGVVTNSKMWEIRNVIGQELQGPSSISGYRTMWSRLRLFHNIHVPRDLIMRTMQEMDPAGCEYRRKRRLARRLYTTKGPNHIWHVDGYDKLKQFGFPIHGCVDGYSRKIIWLKAVHSNNDPVVVARLFLNVIYEYNGCPSRLRSDCGSENVLIAAMQSFLRRTDFNDFQPALNCHIYGPSHSNQRIESWWSFYRRNRASYLINFFKDMVDDGILNTDNDYDLSCIRYCFGSLLQKDLDQVCEYWNSHYIRKSGYETVSGRPDELFYLPDIFGAEDQMKNITEPDLRQMEQILQEREQEIDTHDPYYDYFDYLTELHEIDNEVPNWEKALQLYELLISFKNEN